MKRPSKESIKAAIDKLKDKPANGAPTHEVTGKLSPKRSSQRIRKQGV